MDRATGSVLKIKDSSLRAIRTDEEGNLSIVPSVSGLPFQYFITPNGDGTGDHNLNDDYSQELTEYWYLADARYEIYSILIAISDDSSFNQGDYGAIAGGLTNGLEFYVQLPGAVATIPLLNSDENPIKYNYDWLALTSDTTLTTFLGPSQTLKINFDIVSQYGKPLTLYSGWKFLVRLHDNLSGLVHHTIGLRGTKYDE